jgi:hypothetical protein
MRKYDVRSALRWSVLLVAVFMLKVDLAVAGGTGSIAPQYTQAITPNYSLIAPRSGQFDPQIEGLFGFTGPAV